MIWNCTKNGVFSVKSVYQLAQTMKKRYREETSRSRERDDILKNLWCLNVAPIVKFFLWKASNDILPIRSNLYSRKVIDSSQCMICMKEVETMMHVIWSCPATKDVWAKNGSPTHKKANQGEDFMEFWRILSSTLKMEQLKVTATIMKGI